MTGQDRHFDHIPDDPIEAALRNARAGQETAPPKVMPHGYMPPDHLEPCPRCHGTGRWAGSRQCFKCQGKGKVAFKTSSVERQIKREKYRDRKAANAAEWRQENAALVMWLTSANEQAQQT